MKNLIKIKCSKILFIVLLLNILLGIYFLNLNYSDKEELNQFDSIIDYKIGNTDSNIVKKIDSDIRPLLNKFFGNIKIDKHFILKDKDSFHIFYFSEKVPFLENVINSVVPAFSNIEGYETISTPDSRTYNYNIEFEGKKYLVIFHILSYELENDDKIINNESENMGIFMLYIKKL